MPTKKPKKKPHTVRRYYAVETGRWAMSTRTVQAFASTKSREAWIRRGVAEVGAEGRVRLPIRMTEFTATERRMMRDAVPL